MHGTIELTQDSFELDSRQKAAKERANSLPLADTEMASAFPHRTVVTGRQAADELIGLSAMSGFPDFGVGRARTAVGNVFANCRGKKKCVLKHDRNLRAKRLFCDLP